VRALFLALVAANLALAAWMTSFAPDLVSDPRPLAQQIEPDKLRIVGPGEPPAAGAAPERAPGPERAAAPAAACLEWGGFAVAEAPKALEALAPLALGEKLVQRRTDETAGWWVYMPPQGSRAAAQKKAAELKALGVEEYFIVQDEGPQRWALSLGVFRSEDLAKGRLEALKARGVRSAQVGERQTPVQKVWLQLRGADAAQQAKLREIAPGFAGTELRDCPAPS
jgi:hypothetical protein